MAEAIKKAVKTEKPTENAATPGTADVQKAAPKAVEAEAPSPEIKAEAKKEADRGKEFVDGIMSEMSLKGASKKRLIRTLAEQYNFDKQKVMFRLKRALITERYAAVHAEAGGR